ncbi:MAG: hypothetical protein KAH99_07360, partial [Verrucomicrobia bacterium]|nr:hypothetical protein [Verrucomicrobiota bacterium]
SGETADTLAALPIDAIKIHNLHIEKGTALAEDYKTIISHKRTQRTQNQAGLESLGSLRSFVANEKEIHPLMEYDFAEHLMDLIRHMPPNIPIMRLTTDTLDEELIAPKWHMAKGQFKDYVIQQMVCREWRQGDLWRGRVEELKGSKVQPFNLSTLPPFNPVTTTDGSITFWNEEYKEHYHTPAGARLEAMEKYVVPGKLKERLERGDVKLLDVCFGLGYNSLTAGGAAASLTPGDEAVASPTLSITALEMDRRVVGAAAKNIQPCETDAFDWKKTLDELHAVGKSRLTPHASLVIHWGDARFTITKL